MNQNDDKNYQEFFKEDLYDGFVQYLLNEYGAYKVLLLLKDDSLMSKKGVHPLFVRDFNRFLTLNPSIHRTFARHGAKFMSLRNIAGGPLAFPVDPDDERVMIKEKLRVPEFIPVNLGDVSRGGPMKKSAGPMKGQTIRTNGFKSKRYRSPKKVTIHFKSGFATYIGKTTMTFKVESREEAMYLLLDKYQNKVAYAYIQNEEEFCFVKPKDGSKRKNRKLCGKV